MVVSGSRDRTVKLWNPLIGQIVTDQALSGLPSFIVAFNDSIAITYRYTTNINEIWKSDLSSRIRNLSTVQYNGLHAIIVSNNIQAYLYQGKFRIMES